MELFWALKMLVKTYLQSAPMASATTSPTKASRPWIKPGFVVKCPGFHMATGKAVISYDYFEKRENSSFNTKCILHHERESNQKSPTYSCTWSNMTNCTDETDDLPGEITCRNDEVEIVIDYECVKDLPPSAVVIAGTAVVVVIAVAVIATSVWCYKR